MTERQRVKQTQSLEERLAQEARRLRDEARLFPPGLARDTLLRRARQTAEMISLHRIAMTALTASMAVLAGFMVYLLVAA